MDRIVHIDRVGEWHRFWLCLSKMTFCIVLDFWGLHFSIKCLLHLFTQRALALFDHWFKH